MDRWLQENVLAGNKDFTEAAKHVPIPVTVWDEEPVQAWSQKVDALDSRLCATIRFLTLRKSVGFEPTDEHLRLVTVSVPLPPVDAAWLIRGQAPWMLLNKVLAVSCPQLEEFLGIGWDDPTVASPSTLTASPSEFDGEDEVLLSACRHLLTGKAKAAVSEGSPPPTLRPAKRNGADIPLETRAQKQRRIEHRPRSLSPELVPRPDSNLAHATSTDSQIMSVLTFEQKKDLSVTIQTLGGQKLERVIQIIREGVPEVQNVCLLPLLLGSPC